MASPGVLLVTMQPRAGLSLDQFNEWYNNEHGPTRLRLPRIFTNGLRYTASDNAEPTFLAVYDVASMSHLLTPTYTQLRANRSTREAETIAQVDVNRSFYDTVSERSSPLFVPIERLTDDEARDYQLVVVEYELADTTGAEETDEWFENEHNPLFSKLSGWLRTRRFKSSSIEETRNTKYLVVHEFAKENGLGTREHKAAETTPCREKMAKNFTNVNQRTYSLFYVFGPAARDLLSLSSLSSHQAFTSPDSKTTTTPGSDACIFSYITTADGLSIPYRLEGNHDPAAPVVAFSNSLLTSLHMWDPFVTILRKNRPDLRILRYDTRGRQVIPQPPVAATIELLSKDIEQLLTALRIPKLRTLVGVSMGGATVLHYALTHPSRLDKFIACDFNIASSEKNTQAWKDRITVAETPVPENGGKGIRTLAEQTVERWLHPNTMANKPAVALWMTDMVAANDVQGFKYGCRALWNYDLEEKIRGCQVPGLLAVGQGDGDGMLVKAMEGFKDMVGGDGGIDLRIIPEAGHLPMCENPRAFWEHVRDFI